MTDIVDKLKATAFLKAEQNKGFGRSGKQWAKESELEWQAADAITALRQQLAEATADHAMVTELYNAAVSDYTGAKSQLAAAVEALETFARIGGYVTEDCGWTPDDEIELMFGDRVHVLATTEARHFIRAREIHRKAMT